MNTSSARFPLAPCPLVGVHIRRFRKEARLTQEAVAVAIDVSTNTVSRWETSCYQPSPRDLWALSKLFNVSISNFFGEPDLSGLFGGAEEVLRSRVLHAFNQLTASLRLPRVVFETRDQGTTHTSIRVRHPRRAS